MEIRDIKDSEIEAAVVLHNESYGDSRTPEHWTWEYRGNKANSSDQFVFTVAESDGHIVGTQGMIPIFVNIDGAKRLTGKSENSLVDSGHKGGGVFFKLYNRAMARCQQKNIQCVWGFTGLSSLWRRKLEFEVYEGVMAESILVLNPRQAAAEINSKKRSMPVRLMLVLLAWPFGLYGWFRRLATNLFSVRIARDKFVLENKLRSMDHMRELYDRLRAKCPNLIHLQQDEDYINWRVYHNPNVKYKTAFVYEDDKLQAYCYFTISDRNTAYLSDLAFDNPDAAKTLLDYVLSICRKQGVGVVSFLGNTRNRLVATVFDLLKRHGAIKKVDGQAFVLKNISYDDEKRLYDVKNWYLTGLWSEGYMI